MIQMAKKALMLVLVVWLGVAIESQASVGQHKADDLRRKMSEIESLQVELARKIEQAMRLRAELIGKKRELVDEIRDEQERHGYATYKAAVQNSRVDFNLQLVQRIGIYSRKLTERIQYFRSGAEELTYLYRQAEDDLKMVQTLDDMQVDDLMSHINRSLTSYRLEIDKKLINVHQADPKSGRHIWDAIMAGTY